MTISLEEAINNAIELHDSLNSILPIENFPNWEWWLEVAYSNKLINKQEGNILAWYLRMV
jgi:hypothetical protein